MNGLSGGAIHPLATLDPAAPPDDLDWLDAAIGDARVVAIGESAHYNRESYLLRHRLLRHLAERHGFGAYAMESGFVEGWLADGYVRGGDERPGHVAANGLTSLMGLWQEMGDHLAWMRRHGGVRFYGIDLPGSVMSPLPGLDAVTAYLAEADPGFEVDPALRETASAYAAPSAFSAPEALAAYGQLAGKDALTAGLADLLARMTATRLDQVRRTSADTYERALHTLRLTIALDAALRAMARGAADGTHFHIREAAIADTVEWILRREDRVVLAAHNGHVMRHPVTMPGLPPSATMGMRLADGLGTGYLVIGTTTGAGHTLNLEPDFRTGRLFTEMGAPEPGTLDALMTASNAAQTGQAGHSSQAGHAAPFAIDLRHLSPADAEAVKAVSLQRFGGFSSEVRPLDAYDLVVHLPHVTPAHPDPAALACAPAEVREAFAAFTGGS
ncbi:erythromycin esterase [Nonomuraea solani]|uniref:Erythromycin esterase n=1 Tax=Nonomuraea solani TaxID=1144553 RepID=A0A1H5VPJ5_9ACTN|nr:erythromycin esterase family protein [Nonomuraea solani]SEF89164.1 erythromycin esterase [Nonomuraea solani]